MATEHFKRNGKLFSRFVCRACGWKGPAHRTGKLPHCVSLSEPHLCPRCKAEVAPFRVTY